MATMCIKGKQHVSKKGPWDKGQRKNIDFLEKAVHKTLTSHDPRIINIQRES